MSVSPLLYFSAFSALVAGASLACDSACARVGLPRRWTWAVAMVAMGTVPVLPVFRAIGQPFALAWGMASLVMIAIALRGAVTLTRMRRTWGIWHRESFSTPATWLSENVGPAAFGAGRGEIVVPRWAMALPAPDRRLLLLHERSHVAVRDPMLLAWATALVIALPWHLPLRWAFQRLQRTIEHDCDRRVLTEPRIVRRYADLLLHVAERGLTPPAWPQRALGLSGTTASMTSLISIEPELEARLRSLVPQPITWRTKLRAAGAGALALLLVLTAFALPAPLAITPIVTVLAPGTTALGRASRDPAWVMKTADPVTKEPRRNLSDSIYMARNDSLVIAAIETWHPALLKLAATETPYIAIALTPSNEVIAHSIRAGAPVRDQRDISNAAVMQSRFERAATVAELGSSAYHDADFAGRMQVVVNSPFGDLDSLGISHLQVGDHALTVCWVRFRTTNRV